MIAFSLSKAFCIFFVVASCLGFFLCTCITYAVAYSHISYMRALYAYFSNRWCILVCSWCSTLICMPQKLLRYCILTCYVAYALLSYLANVLTKVSHNAYSNVVSYRIVTSQRVHTHTHAHKHLTHTLHFTLYTIRSICSPVVSRSIYTLISIPQKLLR